MLSVRQLCETEPYLRECFITLSAVLVRKFGPPCQRLHSILPQQRDEIKTQEHTELQCRAAGLSELITNHNNSHQNLSLPFPLT